MKNVFRIKDSFYMLKDIHGKEPSQGELCIIQNIFDNIVSSIRIMYDLRLDKLPHEEDGFSYIQFLEKVLEEKKYNFKFKLIELDEYFNLNIDNS